MIHSCERADVKQLSYNIMISGEGKEVQRKIIHIDMDAFFASVEQRDFPQLKGKPVVVGSASQRGVIAAASYEARKYGIYSAMPSRTALKKCPHLIFQPHRFDVYKSVSAQVMDILHDYTDKVEPLSIDEAFLDVSTNKKNYRSATLIAREIQQRIEDETKLTASAGISVNKFLAKIASGKNKPNGLFVIKPDQVLPFIEQLPVKEFYGVGKKTSEKMNHLGIFSGKDMQAWSLNGLVKHFGKAGRFFYSICRGQDDRPVVANRTRKSVGIENTYGENLTTLRERTDQLNVLINGLWRRTIRTQMYGRTVTLKIKFNDFKQHTYSKTTVQKIETPDTLSEIAHALLNQVVFDRSVRLMGLSISNLDDGKHENMPVQLTLDFD
ncbi:DNA polymerase-4 [Saccharicrinis carchari]|uniref:DNA polymerase IV n=1 Tax=Saccharicrinis carchari TaxID=1168039 RepID=A0A521BGZ3_SACCC|nr:DNA polymerase IV [Saccharicrinis carchari]SMO46397.1 DNA polymerase-4 [Saccharicrinis carchari]